MSIEPGGVPLAVKSRVDVLLEQVFSGVISVPSAVRVLLDERSNSVQFCALVVQTVLEESRYVAKYPFSEMRIAAELTGQLIKFGFIPPSHLAVILEAARRTTTSKLFRFAVIVIEQLLDKIWRFPLFCADCLGLPEGFKMTYPRYVSYMASTLDALPAGLRTREMLGEEEWGTGVKLPPVPDKYEAPMAERDAESAGAAAESRQRRLQGGGASAGAASGAATAIGGAAPSGAASVAAGAAIAHNKSVEAILSDESLLLGITPASGSVQDSVSAIFNSLSTINAAEKAGELRQVLALSHGEYVGWVALYMTKNRILKEANLHGAYLSFLQVLNHSKFYESMTNSTYACLKLLLNHSELAMTSSQHRTAVKNLGSWLGMITIGRDKPLRSKDLDLKQILIDAYESGRLSVIIPLVCKVLQACSASKAYRPPNAWTSGILGVLAEIHDIDGLKTNLVFEIEVLGQALSVSLRDFRKPVSFLAGKRPIDESLDFVKRIGAAAGAAGAGAGGGAGGAGGGAAVGGPVGGATSAAAAPAGAPAAPRLPLILPSLTPVIAPSIVLFQMQPKLKPLVGIALERAIKEVLGSVIDRSVNIAVLTTKELVLKDFHQTPNAKAALLATAGSTAATLASSLALVTCKEPLRTAISQHLKQCLTGSTEGGNAGESGLIEQVVQIVTQDNVEIASNVVERVVVDRAIREVEIQINADQATYQYVGLNWLNALPPVLKVANPAVYGEFKSFIHTPGLAGHAHMAPPPPPPTAPPPPMAAPPAPPAGPPTAPQHAIFESLREVAESAVENVSGDLARLLYKLSAELEVLCHDLARSETVVTLPEVVEQQPVYLDAYYALIGCGENAPWLTWLREVYSIIQKNGRSYCAVVVHFFIKAMSERMTEGFAAAIIQDNFTCNVTEHHLWFELALASLSLCCTAGGGGAGDAELLVYGPMYALLVYSWHGNLSEPTLPEAMKQVYMYLGIGLVRYNLVKEPELDKLAVRLFTDFRSIPCTMFVLNFLYLVICKMRMSPISAWAFSMEVISKLGLRVRETGLMNIPIQERPLAERLDLFMREGKAVSNLAVDRVLAYRHLHCITVSGVQMLPAELLEFQAVALSASASGIAIGACLRLSSVEKRQVVMSLIDQYRLANEDKRKSFWQSLKTAGMQFDATSLDWSEAVFAGAVFRVLQLHGGPGASAASGAAAATLDPEHIDWFGGFALSLARDAFAADATAGGDVAKFRVFRKALEAVIKVLNEASGSVEVWKDTTSAWGLSASALAGGLVERASLRMMMTLYAAFVSSRGESGMWVSGVTGQFVKSLYVVTPAKLPRFSLCFLEMLGHREFLPKVLGIRGQRGWLAYARLLNAALTTVTSPTATAADTSGGALLMQGVMRILLVLLHDYPEFLVNYQEVLLDGVPRSAVQVRNLILSAFPKNMKLPDPFQLGLVVRFLPDAKFPVRGVAAAAAAAAAEMAEAEELVKEWVRRGVDGAGSGSSRRLGVLLRRLLETGGGARTDELVYNVCVKWPVMEKIRMQLAGGAAVGEVSEIVVEILLNVLETSEHKYMWIYSMSNHLRFPNSLTVFFSELVITVFFVCSLAGAAWTKECILRVLLERLIVHRPHPWGLLVTFVNLVRDPQFWDAVGNSMNADVEKIFNTVAATCVGGAGAPAASGPAAAAR